jgi:hypothetical protein
LGLGDGTFALPSFYGVGDRPTSVAIGDLNGDQALDLAVANRPDAVAVLLGTRGGPVPVELAWFEVVARENAVAVAWETVFESDHLGFYIYRARAGSARFERLSDQLIRGAREGQRYYEFVDRSVVPGEAYAYRLVAVDVHGGTQTLGLGSVTVDRVLPAALILHQNRPNPFNPSTSIAFELPEPARVTLRIYDVRGSLVRTLVDNGLTRDFYNTVWDGRDDRSRRVASGVYYCRLEAGSHSVSREMVLAR